MTAVRIRFKRSLPIIFITIGLIITLISLGYGYYSYRLSNPRPALLPDTLAGLPLKHHSFGLQAVQEINQLHGLNFPLSPGAVGVYGDQGQATLWISGAATKSMATKLTTDMVHRIAEGNSPFIPTNEYPENGRMVYELDGHGQKHFYFQSNKLIVWLASDENISQTALSETLTYYP